MSQNDKIDITLNEFDNDGNAVNTHSMEISTAQASDVIAHAAQAIIIRRAGGNIDAVLDELEEALTVSGVL
ncbi:MAG: hypothetical protein CL840_15390 [Crocinitomicaceae bacterium]|nr:hypothetical protein [Crocinitomicaceae bacterium]|tara:strand:+ start:92204 stop:92416 length:213 start_codon:yes stop_codon:yes gene_type:complete